MRPSSNCLARVEPLARAVRGASPEASTCLVALAGDVTFSAGSEEFKLAEKFLEQLRAALVEAVHGLRVFVAVAPGNHDCDLPSDGQKLREVVVEGALKLHMPPAPSDESVIRGCLEAQASFVKFVDRVAPERVPDGFSEIASRLRHKVVFEADGKRVGVWCLNTSWLSKLKEKPGELLAPAWLPEETADGLDLTLTLFHHPYGWLEPTNGRAFRHMVERSSDIVLTGHDHSADSYVKRSSDGGLTEYIEGVVFQDAHEPDGGFHIIEVDFEKREASVALYMWHADHYEPGHCDDGVAFVRATRTGPLGFSFTKAHAEEMDDCGATFSHPRKRDLVLDDLYVRPDLRDISFSKGQKEDLARPYVRGDEILAYIATHRQLLVFGDERSGKTALAKMLVRDFLAQNKVPVLVSGEDLKNPEAKALDRLIDRYIEAQYGPGMSERYRQLNPDERVLVVDDLHKSKLNRHGIARLTEPIRARFGIVVAMASDTLQLEEITQPVEGQVDLLSYRRCEIMPFGHRLRGELIEKWHSIGSEYTAKEADLSQVTRQSEQVVNTLLGKNLLPSYPMFVLTILQSMEASTPHSSDMGAYGYHYEALLTASLYAARQAMESRLTLDALMTFMSQVAFGAFESKRRWLSNEEFRVAMDSYRQSHRVRFTDDDMLRTLATARVLRMTGDGRFVFPYRYVFYYFVAKHIASNLHTEAHGAALWARIAEMTAKLHVEDYANVVIFLLYLTKDERTITSIVAHARTLYAEYAPCDMDSHVAFVNALYGKRPQVVLRAAGAKENLAQARSRLDEVQGVPAPVADDEDGWPDEDKELDDLLRLNMSFKTLQIMGQVLRNFPGALPGEVKKEIATECYLLGLRTLRAVVQVVDSHLDEFRAFFAELLEKLRDIEDPVELAATTDRFLQHLVHQAAYAMVKRVSMWVGSEHLEGTFAELEDARCPVSFGLIDISVKLDHLPRFPHREVEDVDRMTEHKPFAALLLRWLVRDYLHLFPASVATRQRVCQKLGIEFNEPRMIAGADKRFIRRRD